jgi:hypothetical protein
MRQPISMSHVGVVWQASRADRSGSSAVSSWHHRVAPLNCLSKQRWGRLERAMRAAQKISFGGGPPLRAYRCPMCSGWHLTQSGVLNDFDIEFENYTGDREDE